MKKITIGIIGPGNHFEKNIYPVFRKYNFLKIDGILRKKNKKFKNIENLKEEFFFKKKFDFIYISCPSIFHEKYIIKSLNNNSHVICEKPFIAGNKKIDLIISLAKKKKKLIFETFMYQYHPSFYFVEKLIKKKIYGKFKYLIANFRYPSLGKKNNRYNKKTGGGFFLDAASYLVSLESFIFRKKKYKRKEIISQKISKKVDLKGNIFINSNNKKRFYFWGEGQNYSNNIEIFFENASIYIDRFFSKKDNEQSTIKLYDGYNKIIKLKKINHFKSMFDVIFSKYQILSFKESNYLKIKNQVNLMKSLK